MLGVRGDYCLPDVLQVVVVGDRSPAFNFCEDTVLRAQSEKEVGPGPSHEPVLWRDHNLCVEAGLADQLPEDLLDGRTLRAVHMRNVDPRLLRLEVRQQEPGNPIDRLDLLNPGRDSTANESFVVNSHLPRFATEPRGSSSGRAMPASALQPRRSPSCATPVGAQRPRG